MRQRTTVAGTLCSLGAAALAMASLGTLGGTSCWAADENSATITVKRESAVVNALRTVNVYVNSEKTGSLSNGETKTLTFHPKKDCNNVLYLESAAPLGVGNNYTSNNYSFVAGRNARVVVRFTADLINTGRITVDDKGEEPKPEEKKARMTLLGLQLTGEPVVRELASEILETPDGIEQEYEISRTIERSVSFTETLAAESGAKLDWKAVAAEVKAKIERQENQTFKESETVPRNLKLDGSKTPKVKITWVGTYRTGTATVYINDVE